MIKQEPLQINVTLNETHIKEAIKDYLKKRGYDVISYNYEVGVREEKQEMGRFSKDLVVYHFDHATVKVKQLIPEAPKLEALPKTQQSTN